MNILEEIAGKTKERIAAEKEHISVTELQKMASTPCRNPRAFAELFTATELNVIAEVKRASPSQGAIDLSIDPVAVASSYLAAGAKAISVLTEPYYFQGSYEFLAGIRCSYPHAILLMKDFFLDEYQVYKARALDASVILIIVAMLDEQTIVRLMQLANDLCLAVLVEVHNTRELEVALKVQAPVIGINNRDLTTLQISLDTTRQLIKKIPPHIPVICESGLKTHADLIAMQQLGCRGFLVGTSLMTTGHPGKALGQLITG